MVALNNDEVQAGPFKESELTDEEKMGWFFGGVLVSGSTACFFGLVALGIGMLFLSLTQAVGLALVTVPVSGVVAFFATKKSMKKAVLGLRKNA